MLKQKLRKGDIVIVITGKSKGKTGEILRMFPTEGKILVAGVNIIKRQQKASKTSAGGIVEKEAKMQISNVAYCENGVATKIAFKIDETGKKIRVSKKTSKVILDKK